MDKSIEKGGGVVEWVMGWAGRFSRAGLAHVLPFGVFMGGLALVGLLEWVGGEEGSWWLRGAKYWVYPLQTVVVGGLLVYFWREYEWGEGRRMWAGVWWGVVVFFLWVSPQMFFGLPGRYEGFDPTAVGGGEGLLFWGSLVMRVVRLAVVVPVMEEVFWRSFLMRWLMAEGGWRRVPFGAANLGAFSGVVVLFAFVHSFLDVFGAVAAGVVYGYLAVRTRSLGACVVAHAVTNLLLGVYVLWTRQWGFW